jgi:hypothetical protein
MIIFKSPTSSALQIGYPSSENESDLGIRIECANPTHLPVKPVSIVDAPMVWISRSDADNRGKVIVCEFVAHMIAKLLIAKVICSIVELFDLPLLDMST